MIYSPEGDEELTFFPVTSLFAEFPIPLVTPVVLYLYLSL